MAEGGLTIICGTRRGPDAGKAECSSCGTAIYPTTGSLELARANGMAMICTRCFNAVPDPELHGLMHHGQMLPLPDEMNAELLTALEMEERECKRREGST